MARLLRSYPNPPIIKRMAFETFAPVTSIIAMGSRFKYVTNRREQYGGRVRYGMPWVFTAGPPVPPTPSSDSGMIGLPMIGLPMGSMSMWGVPLPVRT